jgi:hypothetical protein
MAMQWKKHLNFQLSSVTDVYSKTHFTVYTHISHLLLTNC